MKNQILALALLLAAPAFGLGQEQDTVHPGPVQVYAAIGPIISNSRAVFSPACYGIVPQVNQPIPPSCYSNEHGGSNIAFGGDARLGQVLSAGIELAYAGPDWNIGKNGMGVGSANATFHFQNKKDRSFEPFLTGGYSHYFGDRTNTQSGFNFGGGVNLWASKHAALRLEIREQGHINYFHSEFTNFVAFRVGVTFR